MEKRVAVIGIFVHDIAAAAAVNQLLHEYSSCIIGRMGLPYRERGVNIISVIIDAAADEINSLGGKLGKITGITAKVMQAKL